MCARGPAASTWCFEPTTYNDDYDNNSIGCIYLHTQIHQAVYITMKLNQLRSPHSAVIGPGFSVLTIRFGWQCEHCFVYLLCLHYIFTSWPLSFDCYAFAFFSLFFSRLQTTFPEPIFFFVIPNNLISICMGYACGVLHHKVLMPTTTKCFISISLAKRVDAWCQQDIQFATTFARTLLNMNIPYSINYIRFYILCCGFFSYLVQFLHSRGLFCKHSLQYLVWIHFF